MVLSIHNWEIESLINFQNYNMTKRKAAILYFSIVYIGACIMGIEYILLMYIQGLKHNLNWF